MNKMDYYLIFGMVMVSLIAILGFLGSMRKSIKDEAEKRNEPINDLNLTITELNVHFKHMLENDVVRDKRLDKHGQEIDKIVEKQRENEKTLGNHELRITTIEKREES